ncbi:hypothetical protein ACF0H5_023285 [Mactra antiquata]
MEFTTTKKDYNVSEFYEQFGESLPRIVKVNQGYFGKVATEVFDKDEIIWLQTVSKQQRVIAKFQLPNRPAKLLSIPVSYDEKLCVVKHGRPGKPKDLGKILEKGHLPITVQFPKDQTITVDEKCMKTDYIPPLELSETFDEMYFLGNFITQGEMSDTVIDIPLYLSQLRFSLVVGRVDHSDTEWNSFIEKLTCKSSSLAYDPGLGHPSIAEYDPSAVHSCDVYSYVRPRAYSNIVNIVNEPFLVDIPSFETIEKEHSSFSKHKNRTGHENTKADNVGELTKQEDTGVPDSNVTEPATLKNIHEENERRTDEDNSSSTDTTVHARLRKTPSNQATPIPAPQVPNTVCQNAQSGNKQQNFSTAVKSGQQTTSGIQLQPDVTETTHSNYLNPQSSTEPKTNLSKSLTHPPLVKTGYDVTKLPHQPLVQTKDDVTKLSHLPLVQTRDDVIKLSISDVGKYLKVLKLEKYVDDFEAAMIDGRILIDVTKDILINEFGFKQTEVLRLMAFSKNGHLPK